MIVNFDYFDRPENPNLFICNPNNELLAPIPHYKNLVIKPTFNGLSTVSIDIYKYIKDKDKLYVDLSRACDCYKYIETCRQIHVENLGYFIINTCKEVNDGINPYISVTANSCEIELNNAGLDIADGTYQFYNTTSPSSTILGKILNLCPAWKIGTVSSTVAEKYRTFTDLNQNIYSFMSGDMSNAFGCIANFDIETRTINIIDSSTELFSTDIQLTFDNVIKNIQVEKFSDNIITALQVSGSNGLEIRNANPLGTNVIYNPDYYKNTNWMTQGLIDAINAWELKITNSQTSYDSLITQIITANAELSNLDGQLADLNTALKALKQTESVSTTADYSTAHAAVVAKQVQVNAKQVEVNNKNTQITSLNSQLSTLQLGLSLSNNFTVEQYIEFFHYIKVSTYQDENITVTNSMTYGEKQNQIKLLYEKGKAVLNERAQPTSTITFDCNNFILMKEFEIFRTQLELGRIIHVELEPNNIVDMALLQYEINYDTKDLKITVSNRLKLHSNFTKLGDLQTQVTASTNTISYQKDDWGYPVKSGILDYLDAASKANLNLETNEIVANAGQRAMFDSYGYHGFKIDPNTGTYSPKQIWIKNNSITMTTDNWSTIKAAFGEFTLSNGTVVYGLNADTIVAGTIDCTTLNVINIIANNIKTGILQSANGNYSLNMETGEVNMKSGTFSGTVESSTIRWMDSGDLEYGSITGKPDTRGISINSDYITLAATNGVSTDHIVVNNISVREEINTAYNGSSYSGQTGSMSWIDKDGKSCSLAFTYGIITDYND